MRKTILITILLLSNALIINAQVSDTTDTEEKTNNIKASFEYMNKAAFSGRDYMVNGGLLSPTISLNFKAGISLEVTSFILPNDTSKTRQTEFGLSYNNDLFDWWNIEGGYTLYRTSVTVNAVNKKNVEAAKVQTQTDNGLSLINTFDFDWMFLYNSSNYFFGTEKGFDLLFMLGKDISLDKLTGVDDLSISPTFTADIGNHFAKFRKLKKNLINATTIANSTKFQPLDYEISLPIEYDLKGFTFNVTPAYAFPVNLLPNESNLGSNFFYISAKITYQFDFKNKN